MEQKNKVASFYNEAFKDHPLISIPYIPEYATRHSWYMYCLNLDKSINRNLVIDQMKESGVDSRLSFPQFIFSPFIVKNLKKVGDFPLSESIFDHFIDIPCWPNLPLEDQKRVVEVICQAVEEQKQ